MKKKFTCILCPKGCEIEVEGDDTSKRIDSIKNYECSRGYEYAKTEFINPCRILTSSVRLEGNSINGRKMVPVRSSKAIPRKLLMSCMKEIQNKSVKTPVWIHQVIIPNILNTGADIIACMPINREGG